MKAGESGIMGKLAFWGIVMAAALACHPAHATSGSSRRDQRQKRKKPHLAMVLPSQVKTIHLLPSRASHAVLRRHGKKRAPLVTASAPAPVAADGKTNRFFAPELREEADQNPGSFKYFKSAVRYVRADFRLPAEYDCDPETAEQKKAEAEAEALAQCEADGAHDCRVAKSLVARNGELTCSDFPQGHCPARGHFRGCVGEALALGEKGEVAGL